MVEHLLHLFEFFHFEVNSNLPNYSNGKKDDVVTLDIRMLACYAKMTSLINKSTDWPSNYQRTARIFLKSSALLHSVNKLTLNQPAMITRIT